MTDILDRADKGGWREIDGGWELRFERRLRHSPERVWKALTTPEGLRCWLAEADIDAVPGGRMNLNFRQPDHDFMPDRPEVRTQSNQVLLVQPFSRFEHTFGGHPESVVSWRLAPDGDGTHLTLIHRIPQSWKDARRNVLSGWHHHMEGLDDAARGVAHPWDWDRWFALRDAYAAEIEGGVSADFLNRLVGEWTYEGRSLLGDDHIRKGVETVTRRGAWLVIESDDGARFQLGFNPDTGRVVGDFVNWDDPTLWLYDGALEGERLVLHSRGPRMDGTDDQTDYQDIWEILSPDERRLTGRLLDRDGAWRDFTVTDYRRKV